MLVHIEKPDSLCLCENEPAQNDCNSKCPAPQYTPDATILDMTKNLCMEEKGLAGRFNALFYLKNIASNESSLLALKGMASAFSSSSALLKHEIAYCLGQTKNLAAIPYLSAVLTNKDEDPMCRHEAAEAMGAIGDKQCLDLLKKYRDDKDELTVVRETCELAIDRITWEHSASCKEKLQNSKFESIDPAPPMADDDSVDDLEQKLLNQTLPLFQRYRAMFSLRDLASLPDRIKAASAVLSLAKGLSDPSALFRHEIAFVFGQLGHPASIPALATTLQNLDEASMVRHEAAEALGSIGDKHGVEEILKPFLNDDDRVVRESVEVALDMAGSNLDVKKDEPVKEETKESKEWTPLPPVETLLFRFDE